MRINEITDPNKTWAALKDFDINSIVESSQIIIQGWPILLSMKSPSLIAHHKRNIIVFLGQLEKDLHELNNFPDQTDPDLSQIRNKLIEIKARITELINYQG
jgi:hypothetical protein